MRIYISPPTPLSGYHDDPYADVALLVPLGIPKREACIIVGLCRDNGHNFGSILWAARSGYSGRELIVLAAEPHNATQDIFYMATLLARAAPQIPDDLFGDEL